MPLRKIHHPVGAYTAEEKKEFAEMNLTDHAVDLGLAVCEPDLSLIHI